MATSLFLARLIGPLFLVMGIGMLVNPAGVRATAREFLASRALIYVAGLAAFVPGLAIVLTHNLWVSDWRVLVTVFGWLALIGGTVRILAPEWVTAMGSRIIDKTVVMTVGAVAVTALGAILAFFGYVI